MSKKIELDLEHQAKIEKVHSDRRDREEARMSGDQKTNERELFLARAALSRAMSGDKSNDSFLGKMVRRFFWGLCFIAGITDFLMARNAHLDSFFYPVWILGFAIRPYLFLNLLTALVGTFSYRLKLVDQWRAILYANSLAKTDLTTNQIVEQKIWQMNIRNQVCALVICIMAVANAFVVFGWEPAITHEGSFKTTVIFFIGMGFVVWLSARKLFALKIV